MTIKGVVFDLDDTLYLERDFVKSGFQEVDNFLKKKGVMSEFYPLAWDLFLSGKRGDIFNRVLVSRDKYFDSNLISEMVEVYRAHKPRINLLDDAKWALSYYHKIYEISLISDGNLNTQKNKFNSLNIKNFFSKTYFTDFWGMKYWKPNSHVFRIFEKDVGLSGHKCVYISDNPLKDFIAPNKLGWRTIQILRSNGEYSMCKPPENGIPDLKVSSLLDLKDIL